MSDEARIALVTGGARGLGLETSRQLAQIGIHVVIGARDERAAAAAAGELAAKGLKASSVQLDVTDEAQRNAVGSFLQERFGKLDILVNNAGVLLDGPDAGDAPDHPPSETPPAILRTTFEANFFGPIFLTQRLLPLLKRSQAPRIVNVSSILGSMTMLSDPDSPAYDARLLAYDTSKAALNMFTVLLAEELRGSAIKINAVHPGWVRTEMGGQGADLDITQGALSSVLYATLPADGPSGGFFHMNERLPW